MALIKAFEIVDLGVMPSGSMDSWGTNYHPAINAAVVGEGRNAHDAFGEALDAIREEGHDASLIAETGRDLGYDSEASFRTVEEIEPLDEVDEDEDEDGPMPEETVPQVKHVAYYVGIRYVKPE